MKFTVGGRAFELTAEEVRRRVSGVDPEIIQKHHVEIDGTLYPPKQVLDVCVGFPRSSFTTMDALRVLNRLGFHARRTVSSNGRPDVVREPGAGNGPVHLDEADVVASLRTLQMALIHLDERVRKLEVARQ